MARTLARLGDTDLEGKFMLEDTSSRPTGIEPEPSLKKIMRPEVVHRVSNRSLF